MTTTAPHRPPTPTPPAGGAAPGDRDATRRVSTGGAASGAAQRTLLALLACALGAISLKALFRDVTWLPEVWAAQLVVIGPALVLRRRREAAPWHVWPGLVLLVPWLTAMFVPQHAIAHLLPTTGAWHDVTGLLADLHRTSSNEVAPIQSTTAVRLVLCAMLGLLTALVDLVAVVGRHGALGGVPLLITFTIAGAVPKHPVSWPLFLVAGVGYLLLLGLDARDTLTSWGRRIPRPDGSGAGGRLGVSAVRLGLVALLVALALPLAIPSRSGNVLRDLFRGGGGAGSGLGVGSSGKIDPFVALAGELHLATPRELFTVHLQDGSGTPFYARVNVLTDYTGTGWRRGSSGDEEPIEVTSFDGTPADRAVDGRTYRATITISGLGGNPPVFDRPSLIAGVGEQTRWSRDDLLLLGDTVDRRQTITEEWQQPEPTIADLEQADGYDASLAPLTRLPEDLPPFVRDLVSRITTGQASAFQAARAIYRYFTDGKNGFSYSLDTQPGDSGSDLVDFLKNKQGYCQQYAAAMAVMLRVADIPSRVVLGYTHPVPDKDGNFVVTTNEAHSWVEAWFPGVGWTPFDPTPLQGITGGGAADPHYAPHPKPSLGSAEPSAPRTSAAPGRSRATQTAPGRRTSTTGTASSSTGTSTALWLAPLIVVVLVGLALLPAALRMGRRRARLRAALRGGDPDPLWAELADTAVDLGYVWSPARSPRQVAQWLAPDAPSATPSLERLAAVVERARYGRAGTVLVRQRTDEAAVWGADLAQVTHALRARRRGRTRLAARLWPASLRLGRVARRKRH